MKKLVYTLLIALSSYISCFACNTYTAYGHYRKMTKDVNVWTHSLTVWSIDLKKDSTYLFLRDESEYCYLYNPTYSYIKWDGDLILVWDSDWDKAKNNSVEV